MFCGLNPLSPPPPPQKKKKRNHCLISNIENSECQVFIFAPYFICIYILSATNCCNFMQNPAPNKPSFLCVCSTSLLKNTVGKGEIPQCFLPAWSTF